MSEGTGKAPVQDTTQPGAQLESLLYSTDPILGEKPVSTEQPKADPVKTEAPKTEEVKTQEAEKKDAPKEEVKAPEVKYELKLPKGALLSAEHVEKVAAFAKQRGFSPEQAQALLERENGAVSEFVQNQNDTVKTKMNNWVNEIKADKEIGGEQFSQNVEAAKKAVERFATPEFKQTLNESGLGNHPELVRVFARIGKAMSDDKFVLPGAQSGSSKSIEDIFYPQSK